MRVGRLRAALIAIFALAASACTTVEPGVAALGPGLPGAARTLPKAFDGETALPMPTAMVQDATPAGYVSFCLRFPDQCTAPADAPTTLALDGHLWAELTRVNAKVNDDIYPESDQRHYGRPEYWNIPTDGYGDCEDFALTKRKALIDEGFSEAALRIAVVLTDRSERHAVLTVTTDKGDYVLDSLAADIRPWNSTDYTWIERQDPQLGWVSLRASRILLANNSGPTAAVK